MRTCYDTCGNVPLARATSKRAALIKEAAQRSPGVCVSVGWGVSRGGGRQVT